MEPEQNQQPLQQTQVPAATPVATVTTPPVPPTTAQPSSKHMLLPLITVAILGATVIGGIFLYINNKTAQETLSTTTPIIETPTPSPTITPANQEEADLQQIDVESGLEADLKDIEKDVQSL